MTLPPGLKVIRERAKRLAKKMENAEVEPSSAYAWTDSYTHDVPALLDLIEELAGALEYMKEERRGECRSLDEPIHAALTKYREF